MLKTLKVIRVKQFTLVLNFVYQLRAYHRLAEFFPFEMSLEKGVVDAGQSVFCSVGEKKSIALVLEFVLFAQHEED